MPRGQREQDLNTLAIGRERQGQRIAHVVGVLPWQEFEASSFTMTSAQHLVRTLPLTRPVNENMYCAVAGLRRREKKLMDASIVAKTNKQDMRLCCGRRSQSDSNVK